MTDAPRRKVFLSSSNMSEKLFALAREFPQYEDQIKTYGWDLDVAVETDGRASASVGLLRTMRRRPGRR